MSEELAYAAALFEGEGSTGYYGSDWRAVIEMTDLEPLERMRAYVQMGRVSGPRLVKDHKPKYRWAVTKRAEVAALYELLRPWLSPRRCAQFETTLAHPWRGRGSGPREQDGTFRVGYDEAVA